MVQQGVEMRMEEERKWTHKIISRKSRNLSMLLRYLFHSVEDIAFGID